MPCRLWAQLWGEEETCTGRETGPKWLLVASASFPFFSADQFVVSVPTEVPGSFNKTKVNWGGGAFWWGWWRRVLGRQTPGRGPGHSLQIF